MANFDKQFKRDRNEDETVISLKAWLTLRARPAIQNSHRQY